MEENTCAVADSMDRRELPASPLTFFCAIQSSPQRPRRDPDRREKVKFPTNGMSGGAGNDNNEKALRDLTSTINEKITQGTQKAESLFSSACIFRVPKNLRGLNNSAYTPHLISIGPLHRNDKYLKETPMLQVKLYYANHLFLRLTEGKVDQEKKSEVLQECVKEMKKSVDDARKSYAQPVKLDEEMMVVDGCFILELFYRYYDRMKEQEERPINGGGNSEVRKQLWCCGGNLEASSSIQQPQEGEDSSKSSSGELEMASSSIQQPQEGEDSCKSSSGELEMASNSIQQPQEGEDSSKSSSRDLEMVDPILDNILTNNIVKHDLLLLENQIPFFVLKKLFKLTVEMIPNCPHKLSLVDYVLSYFRDTMSPGSYLTRGKQRNEGEEKTEGDNFKNSGSAMTNSSGSPNDCVIHVSGDKTEGEHAAEKDKYYYHILHLLHDNYVGEQKAKEQTPTKLESSQKTKFSEFTLSASNLEYGGVRFKALSGDNPFDVNFVEKEGLHWWCHRASFDIPTIGIHDSTEPFLRNLIAFEQCCPGVSQHFTSYAFLMDMLINSETDVQVLKDAEVISNYLGADEDISNLFNKLCKEVVLENFYFADPCSKASKYSKYCWPKIMAYLKRTYFSSPWAFIGFCLAFIAFAMSVIQFGWSFYT